MRAYNSRRYENTSVAVPTVERGELFVSPCSTLIVGDSPVISSIGGFVSAYGTIPIDSRYCRRLSLCRISNAIVDFPDPDTPQNTTIWFFGIASVTFFKLCRRAPRTVMADITYSLLQSVAEVCIVH